jgi:predicted RNA-binding Zn-ribbon protein involved in translation (DUF1610 family)
MAFMTCQSCGAEMIERGDPCPHCGQSAASRQEAPIRKLSGQFRVVAVFILAIAVIGTLMGTWWGPPALLPGVAVWMMSKFL